MEEKLQAIMDYILAYCDANPYAYKWCIVDTYTYEISEGDNCITPVVAVERLQHEIDLWTFT